MPSSTLPRQSGSTSSLPINPRDLHSADARIIPGLLYRSDQEGVPASILRGDPPFRTIVDLRHPDEISAFDYRAHLPSSIVCLQAPIDLEAAKSVYPGTPMESAYRYLSCDCRTEFSFLLRTLQHAALPCVIHCRQGVDRTGAAVALLLHILGIPHDDIVRDYLLDTSLTVRTHIDIFLSYLNANAPGGAQAYLSEADVATLKKRFLRP